MRSVAWLFAILVITTSVMAEDWPGWLGEKRDGIVREPGYIETFPKDGPTVLWRVPVGLGYSGPAIVKDRIYLTDRELSKDSKNPDNPFNKGKIIGNERILCLNTEGKVLWKHAYDCPYEISYAYGPRCTPVVDGKYVYYLGAMGDLLCLNVEDGKVLWQKSFMKDYGQKAPLWGWSATPLIDGDNLICLIGGKGTMAVAFDKKTGKEVWRSLSGDEPGYCPPMIYTLDGTRQLIIWHPTAISSIDPKSGKELWSVPFRLQANLSIPTPRQLDDNRLFVTSFYNGPKMLEITGSPPQAKILWEGKSNSERRTEKLHSIMVTPFIRDGHIYGVCSYGQLRCLNAETGERVWESLESTTPKGKPAPRDLRWANAFLIQLGENSDHYYLFNELGELISAKLNPSGYKELDRAKLIEPTQTAMGRDIVWTYPALSNGKILVRNDKELACFVVSKSSR